MTRCKCGNVEIDDFASAVSGMDERWHSVNYGCGWSRWPPDQAPTPILTPEQEKLLKSMERLADEPARQHVPHAGGGVREAQGERPRFELLVPLDVPFEDQFLTRFAVHMAKGAAKYAERNWEEFSDVGAFERCKSAAFRHLFQWVTGVEDGEDHAAAVVFNLMAAEHIKGKEDRKASERQPW